MSATTRLLVIVSTLIAGLAAVTGFFELQIPLLKSKLPNPKTKTYCYKDVRTHDATQLRATCFSVKDGVFDEVWDSGDEEAPTKRKGVESIDGYVIPGLWDGHGHLMKYGELLHSVNLFGSKSFEDVNRRVEEFAEKNPDAGTKENWIRGTGWDQMVLGRMPTAVKPSRLQQAV